MVVKRSSLLKLISFWPPCNLIFFPFFVIFQSVSRKHTHASLLFYPFKLSYYAIVLGPGICTIAV